MEDVRIAMGSVAPVPLRLTETEKTVRGKTIDSELLLRAKKAAAAEIRPIDDIRSTAGYRTVVAGNLVAEFLTRLSSASTESGELKDVLERWNHLSPDEAAKMILPCCGSRAWAEGMAGRRPFVDKPGLLAASDEVWRGLTQSDWMEAFQSHPRIGESRPVNASSSQSQQVQSVEWSTQEQRKVGDADDALEIALASANRKYERRFNRIFIVCATGKSASEILEILQRRLDNDTETELHEAAEQQRQIMEIRLRKWLQG